MQNQPLKDIRILDIGWVYSIPHCTAWLGTLGADVIRLETTDHPDIVRMGGAGGWADGIPGVNRCAGFNGLNYSKRGITLNLTTPEGIALARELVAVSDVVTENFASGVMERLGLGYAELRKIRPDIILLSGSMLGSTGTEQSTTGWGPNACSFAGLPFITGYPGGPPGDLGGTWPDYCIGTAMVFALLSALYHRRRTGQGQHLEVAMSEVVTAMIPEAVLEYTMNGRQRPRMGNRDDAMAPHGVYPCLGDDAWVAIAVSSDAEWAALCGAIGDPAAAADPRFADALSRQRNQDELNATVAGWTRRLAPYEAMHTLQKAGVAAAPVLDVPALVADPQLQSRGFITAIDHPEVGARPVAGLPAVFSAIPELPYGPAPCLGQHNEAVFGDLLAVDRDELHRLSEAKVIY